MKSWECSAIAIVIAVCIANLIIAHDRCAMLWLMAGGRVAIIVTGSGFSLTTLSLVSIRIVLLQFGVQQITYILCQCNTHIKWHNSHQHSGAVIFGCPDYSKFVDSSHKLYLYVETELNLKVDCPILSFHPARNGLRKPICLNAADSEEQMLSLTWLCLKLAIGLAQEPRKQERQCCQVPIPFMLIYLTEIAVLPLFPTYANARGFYPLFTKKIPI